MVPQICAKKGPHSIVRCVCFWQTKQDNVKQTDFILSVDESGGAEWSAECILGETMPLIRDPLNLGEMTAIHLGVSQQSRRGGGGATLPKHDWLMSDVECKLIYSSLLCLEWGRERRNEDETETDRARLQCFLMAVARATSSAICCCKNILETWHKRVVKICNVRKCSGIWSHDSYCGG